MHDDETAYLRMVLAEIRTQSSLAGERSHLAWDELRSDLASYWDEHLSYDEAEDLAAEDRQEQLHTLHALAYRNRKILARMAASPYFGRIDFLEDGGEDCRAEKIYIGLGSLYRAADGEYLVHDWRAPVCSMFYDYERGRAAYQCPAGTVRGEITLKRQYKIENGHLEYMFDCDLKIDDEILQRLLSKNTGARMQSIVLSIQREQNRAIRDEAHRLLIIQGAAGSGKTSIALHRAAFLLYRERETITAKNILILSPNRVFSDYISGVLPELGEENVRQSTFGDYLKASLAGLLTGARPEDWPAHMEYLLTEGEGDALRRRISGIRFKAGAGFANMVSAYAARLEQLRREEALEFAYRDQVIMGKDEWRELFCEELSFLPLRQRLNHLRRRVLTKMRPFIKAMRRQEEEKIAATGEEVNEKTIKALARLAVWQNLRSLREELERATALDVPQLYRGLYEDPDPFREAAAGVEPPVDWPLIRADTLERLDRGGIPYEDLIPLLYLQGCLAGFPANGSIRHLIVDEAQDYTALQFELFRRLFPRAFWTILGDAEQTVHPGLSGSEFRALAGGLDAGEALSIRLSKSYRSTGEIVRFCRALLPGSSTIEYMHRAGSLPEIRRITPGELAAGLAAEIVALREAGCRSIAVVCKTARESARIQAGLARRTEAHLVTSDDLYFRRGVLVLPVYLAKGLEFDAVIIPDAGAGNYRCDWEDNVLYVACTRALHRLVLFYAGELSPFIQLRCAGLYKDLTQQVQP